MIVSGLEIADGMIAASNLVTTHTQDGEKTSQEKTGLQIADRLAAVNMTATRIAREKAVTVEMAETMTPSQKEPVEIAQHHGTVHAIT